MNFYKVSVDRDHYVVLLTDSTENVHIEGEVSTLNKSSVINGSSNTILLTELRNSVDPIKDEIVELTAELKTPGLSKPVMAQYKSDIANKNKEKKTVCLEFLETNQGSPATFAALSELSFKTDLAHFNKVLETTKGGFGHTFHYKLVSQQVANAQKQGAVKKQGGQDGQTKNAKYVKGMEAPELSFNNPEGEVMNLSDLRGKVVLIDFWASWCGPCRRENPNVVKSYDKYNKDGFEIFSVSLDRQAERWKQAIAQDGLKWPYHVSDLGGWKSQAAAIYGIHSIPHALLIDRDGTIIETHLRGAALEAKLAEIFGH
jgi:thiol-disulfide isomerase/thioredoxin